ncbi:MAG TPA: hypothetical protein VNJ02_08050 [Vicinamibacterales bacterium]|nr:hypothetical protein [Vicinamibacterales bacterium]
MTVDEAIDKAGREIDAIIEGKLIDLEARLHHDCLATGDPDRLRAEHDGLDRVPDPGVMLDSGGGPCTDNPTWSRVSVEAVVAQQRAEYTAWRDETLRKLRADVTTFAEV